MEEGFTGKLKSNLKKYLPFIGIAVAVILVIVILVSIFGGGPKKVVKKFVNAINKQKTDKLIECIDFAGSSAWKYSYDENDFSEDDYDEFIEDYEDVDKDDIKDDRKDAKESFNDMFDSIEDDYKSYNCKIEEFKSVKKLGKDLYAVKAKVSITAKPKDKSDDEIDLSNIATFIVYKNKLVYSDVF